MKRYRIWITVGPGEEKYELFDNMTQLVDWFIEKDKPLGGWGIEKYDDTQDIWVDAFYCDDLIELMWRMRDKLLDI